MYERRGKDACSLQLDISFCAADKYRVEMGLYIVVFFMFQIYWTMLSHICGTNDEYVPVCVCILWDRKNRQSRTIVEQRPCVGLRVTSVSLRIVYCTAYTYDTYAIRRIVYRFAANNLRTFACSLVRFRSNRYYPVFGISLSISDGNGNGKGNGSVGKW